MPNVDVPVPSSEPPDVDFLMRPPSVAVSVEWTPHVAIASHGRSYTSTCHMLT